MRQLVLLSSLCVLLSACSGNDLDSPVKTCQSVASILIGSALPSNIQATQKDNSDGQIVILAFQLSDEQREMNVECRYELESASGGDSDTELFGKYEKVPSEMLINGQAVRRPDLIRAINSATVQAGKKVVKEADAALQKL